MTPHLVFTEDLDAGNQKYRVVHHPYDRDSFCIFDDDIPELLTFCLEHAPDPTYKQVIITKRAYEVLTHMVTEGDENDSPMTALNISDWIMCMWDGYCDEHGEPDVEIG